MELFKCIFDNNSSKTIKMFFRNNFIKRLWPSILANFTYDIVFGDKQANQDIDLTYRDITRTIT